MSLSKYSELKIAGNVLGFSIREFAQKHKTYPQVIRDVCDGSTTSARLSDAIDNTIAKADKVYQEHKRKKLKAVSH